MAHPLSDIFGMREPGSAPRIAPSSTHLEVLGDLAIVSDARHWPGTFVSLKEGIAIPDNKGVRINGRPMRVITWSMEAELPVYMLAYLDGDLDVATVRVPEYALEVFDPAIHDPMQERFVALAQRDLAKDSPGSRIKEVLKALGELRSADLAKEVHARVLAFQNVLLAELPSSEGSIN